MPNPKGINQYSKGGKGKGAKKSYSKETQSAISSVNAARLKAASSKSVTGSSKKPKLSKQSSSALKTIGQVRARG